MATTLRRRRSGLLYLTACCVVFVYGFISTSGNKDLPINILGSGGGGRGGGVSSLYPWQYQNYDEYDCGCPRSGPPIGGSSKLESLCSDWSSSRGPGQRVVSYTVYGDMNHQQVYKQYFSAIEDRIKNVQKQYEGQ